MKQKSKAKGQVLIIGVVFLAVILLLSASLFSKVTNFLRFGSNSLLREQTVNLAEAGVDRAIWQLNETVGGYSGETDTPLGNVGTFSVTVVDKTPSLKTIISTGYLPNSTNPRAKRTIKVDALISSESVSFRYAVQVGTGGVSMANSSTINGNVYSNGSISGSGSSRINGDAYAVGTISSPDPTVTGTKNPGASPQPMPDITNTVQAAKDAATAGGIIDCAITPSQCTINNSQDIGPKKYINGNLSITNNATVTMKGAIWVSGNFSMSQGGTTLKLDDSFGSNSVALVVDGTINLTQGGSLLPTNADPKGYIMLSTSSTSNQAIQISQSGTTAIFYALNGGAELSQTANVTALVSKTLSMQNSATLNYDTGLASAQFSAGPGGSWVIKRGTYRFTISP